MSSGPIVRLNGWRGVKSATAAVAPAMRSRSTRSASGLDSVLAGAAFVENLAARSEKLKEPSLFICARTNGRVVLISLNTHGLPKKDESWKLT